MYPDNDPRSWNYIRKYNKPKINYIIVFLAILIVFSLSIIIYKFSSGTYNSSIAIVVVLLFITITILIFLKQILIFFVKLYQRFAPISVRKNCRFEPSCSDYMILAIEKYGVFKGVRNGINRIYRCSTGDGGFDEA